LARLRWPLTEGDSRRYRITAVIGAGGFGTVYRARMEIAGGFSKDVAIKLVNRDDVAELTLQRFRDEARILGLIRDRAIVNVEPPVQLNGRWAVVMEFVDGCSFRQLLRLGNIPATVVAAMAQEIARAMDKVYCMDGPDGGPLLLLHRDLKPGNIQLTPTGEIKILDFGIAKAEFSNREAQTTAHIGGTMGYIAPERLDGIEGPAGDVFSLGVTMYQMLTGRRPTQEALLDPNELFKAETDPDRKPLMALVAQMVLVRPADRPNWREVEDRCAALIRTMHGTPLRAWSEVYVPKASNFQEDELVGSVLSETLRTRKNDDAPNMPWSPQQITATVLFSVVAITLVGTALASLGGLGWMWFSVSEPPPEFVDVVDPIDEPDTPDEPKDDVDGDTPVDIPPAPPARPRPRPQPKPVAVTHPITISSVPLGATVTLDGREIGTTPIVGRPIPTGAHTLILQSGSERIERRITVGKRAPIRYVWKGGDSWEHHF
jgi:serine/threonine protein kinase